MSELPPNRLQDTLAAAREIPGNPLLTPEIRAALGSDVSLLRLFALEAARAQAEGKAEDLTETAIRRRQDTLSHFKDKVLAQVGGDETQANLIAAAFVQEISEWAESAARREAAEARSYPR